MPTRRIPSLNWLRVFEAAARLQSFARAAEQLGLSSAAVSQQIKALETHFKTPLFTRGAHSIQLTPAGRDFLPAVQQSLNTLEVTAAGLFGSRRRESLSILSTAIMANGWLSRNLGHFQQQYPDIYLQLHTYNHLHHIQSHDYDLHIIFGSGPQYGEHEGDHLFRETLFPVASATLHSQIDSLDDLLKLYLIQIREHHNSWLQLFQQAPQHTMKEVEFIFTDNTTTALNLAANGMGVALARMPSCDGLYQNLGLRRCLKPLVLTSEQSYYLTYPARSQLSKAAQLFRHWLLALLPTLERL